MNFFFLSKKAAAEVAAAKAGKAETEAAKAAEAHLQQLREQLK